MKHTSSSRCDLNVEADLLKSADELIRAFLSTCAVEMSGALVLPSVPSRNMCQMAVSMEPGDGDDGFFGAPAGGPRYRTLRCVLKGAKPY